ncbi:MAG: hypothetical protein AB1679_05030 [Actinomycetota bacterium]
MTSSLLRLRWLGAVMAAAVALAGCARSDASVEPTAGQAVKALEIPNLPADLLGLKLAPENVTEDLAKVPAAFIDALSLYSLRKNDLVMATLQVSRFNDGADVDEDKFRQTVVNQIGSTAPRTVRLGGETVYLTTGTKQSIGVWFKGRHLFVLATRADYDEPRTLLRKALEIQP